MKHPAFTLTKDERRDQHRRIRTLPGDQRALIAKGEVLSARSQTILSHDPWASVRKALSENPHLLRTTQVRLAADPLHSVQRHLAEHQACLHPEAEQILAGTNDTSIYAELSRNPGTLQPLTLAKLANCGRHDILGAISYFRKDTTREARHLGYEVHSKRRHYPWGDDTLGYRLSWILTEGRTEDFKADSHDMELALRILHDGHADDTRELAKWRNVFSDELLQTHARCQHLPEHVDEWSKQHPRREDILALAPNWLGTYEDLLEAVELTAR